MATIDIISAASNAYRLLWAERRYVARLALVPLVVKIVSLGLAAGLIDNNNILRFNFLMIPSFLVDGWMLAHFARLIAFGHRWPFRPSGDAQSDRAELSDRARGVLSGMICFALINMALGLVSALLWQYLSAIPAGQQPMPEDLPPGMMALSISLLAGTFWGFHLLWLYVPLAVGMPATRFIAALKGFRGSVHLIGIWVACLFPCLLAARMVSGLVNAALGDGSDVPNLLITALLDTVKSLLITGGVTFAMLQVFSGPRAPRA